MADSRAWAERFFGQLGRQSPAEEPALEQALASQIQQARARWPAVSDQLDPFLDHLAGVIPAGADAARSLGALKVSDLYLAFHCCAGDAAAVAAFEQLLVTVVQAALARINTPAALRDEVAQVLRERMLVGGAGWSPALAAYAGRGSLAGFVRISALREAYRHAEQQRRWAPDEEQQLARLAAPDADPELGYLKALYRERFKEAFAAAMAALEPRQRNILRHYYLDGLSIDQIGALYHVHRATAARQLQRIRDELGAATRQSLMQGLAVDPAECDSIMRLIESRLEVSICSLLDDGEKK